MSYHLFLHENYDAAGGMNDYVGSFEDIDGVLDGVANRPPYTPGEGEVAQFIDGRLEIVGYIRQNWKSYRRHDVYHYWVEFTDGTKSQERIVKEYDYDVPYPPEHVVELPPGYYVGRAGDIAVLAKIPEGGFKATGFFPVNVSDPF